MKLPPNVKVASPEECEKAKFSVCLPASWPAPYFSDNMHGRCSICGTAIIFRPYLPVTPKKICIRCFVPIIEEEGKTNQKTIDGLKAHIKDQDSKALRDCVVFLR